MAWDTTDSTAPAAPVAPRRGSGCLLGMGLGCLVSLGLVVGAFFCFAIGSAKLVKEASNAFAANCSGETTCAYTLVRGADESGKQVLRLTLKGVITGEPVSRWMNPRDCDLEVRGEIERAIEDKEIRAILLVIDSPGGSVTASDMLYHALERFKAADKGRRVVVLGQGVVASGAYYAAMQADWIRLQPTGIVGSIGVIMPGINLSALASRLGVADNSIASGNAKDLGNPLKPVNPEHNALLQGMIDGMYARFVSLVAQGRHLAEKDVRALADGRIFLPQDAQNLRLIDDVGYEETLDAKLAELLECETKELCIIEPSNCENALRAFLSDFPFAVGRGVSAPFAEQTASRPQLRWNP